MADCSAGGTQLDRTVQSLLGSGSASQTKTAEAIRQVLGHATQQQAPSHAAAASMPLMAPTEVILPSGFTYPQPTAADQLEGARTVQQPTSTSYQSQQQFHNQPTIMIQHPNHHPLQHHHPQQQQQQMMMMQSMMMQQQQQLSEMVRHQKQQQQQSQARDMQSNDTAQSTATAPWDSDFLDEAQLKAEMQQHLQSLQQHEHEYQDGFAQGATMEELAAAWAEAEAEYAQDMDQAVNDATNLASAVETNENVGDALTALQPYEFIHKAASTTASRMDSSQRADQQQQEQKPLQDWMKEGMRQFEAGNIKEAIRAFEMELQLGNENNAKAWRMLGRCHAENDQDREAILCLEHAVDRDPYSAEALLDLGVSYVNELNHEKALESLLSWITHNPNYAGMELTDDNYGAASSGDNEDGGETFDEVQRLLMKAVEYNPSDAADVWQALGVVFNVTRDYNAAVDAFEKALQAQPNDYQLWNKLGATLANSNRSERALPAYREALQLKPKYARAWLNMAISHSNLQNYEEAARCYLQTLSLNPAAVHCWSYLRIALSCAEQYELIPFAAAQDLAAFQEHYDFVMYSHSSGHD
mmetsp:Transcript_22244/g.61802  ORF Transcript_22244/g.61802 Transcript_22244/m.61802 type:complete len:585 (-) Transcript_22244:48-1802(-)